MSCMPLFTISGTLQCYCSFLTISFLLFCLYECLWEGIGSWSCARSTFWWVSFIKKVFLIIRHRGRQPYLNFSCRLDQDFSFWAESSAPSCFINYSRSSEVAISCLMRKESHMRIASGTFCFQLLSFTYMS